MPKNSNLNQSLIQIQIQKHDIEIKNRLSLKNFHLKLQTNQMTAIIGLNGAGKSTLIHYLMSGLQKKSPFFLISFDEIVKYVQNFQSNQLNQIRKTTPSITIAYANQSPAFHPHLFWPDVFKFLPTIDHDQLDSYQQLFEIKKAPIHQLSMGNIQLVNLLLTFVQSAQLLIFDEPTNHLDWLHQKALVQALCMRKKNACILIITHDLNLICQENGFDQVLYLNPGHPNGFCCWDLENYQKQMRAEGFI